MDRSTVLMMQFTLQEHGYDVGEPDGSIGPATRKGLSAFASDHGVAESVESVLGAMEALSRAARRTITDAEEIEKIRDSVSRNMLDPDSARLRDLFQVRAVDSEIICGEVNAKNTYGGYVGYRTFYGVTGTSGFWPVHIDDQSGPIAELKCRLAFPRQ